MDPVTLFSPDGREYVVDTPAEEINLRAQGYTNEPREEAPQEPQDGVQADGDPVVAPASAEAQDGPLVVDIQHPENYSVEQLDAFLKENPSLRPAVVKAEKARGDDARKTVVGQG